MSITNHPNQIPNKTKSTGNIQAESADAPDDSTLLIQKVLEQVQQKIAPVWPLQDYVAVNPYLGVSDQHFLKARESFRRVSDLELLMPLNYYRSQFDNGEFDRSDIDDAIDELTADGTSGAEQIDVNLVVAHLRSPAKPSPTADSPASKEENRTRLFHTYAEAIDKTRGTHWRRTILEEISKHCSAHYDQGQAFWASPWREHSNYQAWQLTLQHDLSLSILGIRGFRKFVANLPQKPEAAILVLLDRLGVPADLWGEVLLCQALTSPGWCAWTRYLDIDAERYGTPSNEFSGLLAIKLAYEAALASQLDFQIDWYAVKHTTLMRSIVADDQTDTLVNYLLLKASEIGFRKRLLSRLLSRNINSLQTEISSRSLAQMVFCIDVRSERLRRNLESTSSRIQTFGFAGFFGVPMEFVKFGETEGRSQVPALITPRFKVQEEIIGANEAENLTASKRLGVLRNFRKSWHEFQASAIGTFGFVETAGPEYALKLLGRLLGIGKTKTTGFDDSGSVDRKRMAPSLRALTQQGISTSQQTGMAESILRGIGLISNFSKIVVLCGHSSQTDNNPLQAGLDCGACGGHSGEANARFTAMLLNQKYIREGLRDLGIEIPEDTHFLAALHNTTTDELIFFDLNELPESHHQDLEELVEKSQTASSLTRHERLKALPGGSERNLSRRSKDWSEVRPEWGLAGNAAFIIGPREMSKAHSFEGRTFLHSYVYQDDYEFAVLEQIMTAPMIVANWINLQYYASTVDPGHFGSGNKTVHNVVGRFGIFSGNGGDLMTGLPWQSIHDGIQFQHLPIRLLVVITAPRFAIQKIVEKHSSLSDLFQNGWMQLTAIDDGGPYRYTEQGAWEKLHEKADRSEMTLFNQNQNLFRKQESQSW
ncbi:MAG: DUF2309 domain-containing protein [Pirellulaceae bacterium]